MVTEGGAQGRDRTTDTVIFSHVLYQLSYLGAHRKVEPSGGAAPLTLALAAVHPVGRSGRTRDAIPLA